MRVLILSQWKPSVGGVVTHVEKLMENSESEYRMIGYPRVEIPLLRALSYIVVGLFSALRLSRLESFSLIHAHYALPQGLLGAMLKKLLHLPLVLTLHGSDINLLARSRLTRPVIKFVLGQCDYICTVSSYLREEAIKLGAEPGRTGVVYGAPKVERLGRREPESGLVLYVGSFERQKGLDVLLEAFREVNRELPHARLEVVGGGRRKLRAGRGVSFQGYREDLENYYSRAELVVIPSREEGLSLVALEALALGIPIVATKAGGLKELLEGKAVLVEGEDALAMARAIIRVLKDGGLREKLGVSRREFTGRALAERMDEIYRRVVGESQ